MKEITATTNPLIKESKKLHKKKYRTETGTFLLEGFHLIEEAVKAESKIKAIFVNARGQQEWAQFLAQQPDALLYFVSDDVLKALSDQPTPQGMIAIVELPKAEKLPETGGFLLLDHVQDPGNVGTMIRTADAAGMAGVVLGEGCADPYSLKTLRSMQGSNFHLPVLSMDLTVVIAQLKAAGIPVFGTALDQAAKVYTEVAPSADFALLMGNEGQGLTNDMLEQTNQTLYIPLYGQAESLNVGVAAGILMYHFASK